MSHSKPLLGKQTPFDAAVRAHQQGDLAAAQAGYELLLQQQPMHPDALHLLGLVHKARGQIGLAERLIRQAIGVRAGFFTAYYNLGNLYFEQGVMLPAIEAYRAALLHKADYIDAHYNLGLCLYSLGRYREGGAHYEWRWQSKGFTSPVRDFTAPLWDGTAQPEKTLLIYAEQGLGDVLQFMRLVPWALEKVGRVVFEVPPALYRLVRCSLRADIDVVPQGGVMPAHDLQLALMSLIWRLGLTPETMPQPVPYLKAEAERVALWGARLQAQPSHGLKVGVNWQGNAKVKIDQGRSLPLRLLAPLAKLADIRLISLQKNAGVEQLDYLPNGMNVERLGDDFDRGADAFLDAAAVLKNIDVFVTTDTALAHLAGAIGCPTLLLLKKVPDWRWGLAGETTAFYPKTQLFRQEKAGDWTAPILALVKVLESWQG